MKQNVIILGGSKTNFSTLEEFSNQNHTKIIVVDGSIDNVNKINKTMNCKAYCYDIKNERDSILKIALKEKIVGIYSLNDHGLKTASYIAKKMNLHGLSMSSCISALDKGFMRDVWSEIDINQPKYLVIKKSEEIKTFAEKVGYPIVIKPTDCGGGGRGVFVIKNKDQIYFAYEFAKKITRNNDRFIIEKYIDGVETSVEVVMINGDLKIIAYSHKYKPELNTRVATHIVYPGRFKKNIISKIEESSFKIMQSLGLNNWMGHIEYIINDNKVYAIEIGARAGGGHTLHPIASHVAGLSYPHLILELIKGNFKTISKVKNYSSACYSFFTTIEEGFFENININLPELTDNTTVLTEIWKNKGDFIGGMNDSMQRLGCVITLGKQNRDLTKLNKKIIDDSTIKLG